MTLYPDGEWRRNKRPWKIEDVQEQEDILALPEQETGTEVSLLQKIGPIFEQ